jgi:hypothetical protein
MLADIACAMSLRLPNPALPCTRSVPFDQHENCVTAKK